MDEPRHVAQYRWSGIRRPTFELQSFHIPAISPSTILTSLCYTFLICKRKGSNLITYKTLIRFSRSITLYSCVNELNTSPGPQHPYPTYISAQFPSIWKPLFSIHTFIWIIYILIHMFIFQVHYKCYFSPWDLTNCKLCQRRVEFLTFPVAAIGTMPHR